MKSAYKKIGDDIIILTPSGNIDITLDKDFEDMVNEAIEDNPNCHILMDLFDVGYLNSYAIKVFIIAYKELICNKLKLVLFDANATCKKVFNITGIDEVIKVCNNEEEAVEFIKSKEK